jgi:hypothetical protein
MKNKNKNGKDYLRSRIFIDNLNVKGNVDIIIDNKNRKWFYNE